MLQPFVINVTQGATAQDGNVFLYMYTKNCGYCHRFNPAYTKLAKDYEKQYDFQKVDVETLQGYKQAKKYGCRYVPYVILINENEKKYRTIDYDCLRISACVNFELNKFIKKK